MEVADTSLAYDRDVKSYIYTRSAVAEYWLIDVNDDVLIRHRSPESGTYRGVERFDSHARLSPLLLPDCVIELSDADRSMMRI